MGEQGNTRNSGSIIGIVMHRVFAVELVVVWSLLVLVLLIPAFVRIKLRIVVEPLLWPRACLFEPPGVC